MGAVWGNDHGQAPLGIVHEVDRDPSGADDAAAAEGKRCAARQNLFLNSCLRAQVIHGSVRGGERIFRAAELAAGGVVRMSGLQIVKPINGQGQNRVRRGQRVADAGVRLPGRSVVSQS